MKVILALALLGGISIMDFSHSPIPKWAVFAGAVFCILT
jgi:hypothetical protein